MIYSRIIGTGSYLPSKVLSNKDLEKILDTSNEWIIERTGIENRRVVSGNDTVGSMALAASKKAIEMAGISANDIDLIIITTSTADRLFPSIACFLQYELGITNNCPAYDLGAACAGFIYAFNNADIAIKIGQSKCALVVGSEIITHVVDWEDRSTAILFGDGAGAVILKGDNKPGILTSKLHADGQYQHLLYAANILANRDAKETTYLKMQGSEVFKIAVQKLGDAVIEVINDQGLTKSDIDWLIPHQANIRIIQAVAKRMDLPMEKVIVTVHKHGNTSSASIPLALDEAVRDGRIVPGNTVLLETFGGGFVWGSTLVVM